MGAHVWAWCHAGAWGSGTLETPQKVDPLGGPNYSTAYSKSKLPNISADNLNSSIFVGSQQYAICISIWQIRTTTSNPRVSMHFETFNMVIVTITDRFNEDDIKLHKSIEQMLLKVCGK